MEATSEDSLKKHNQRLQRLEFDNKDRMVFHNQAKETLSGLCSRIQMIEDVAATREDQINKRFKALEGLHERLADSVANNYSAVDAANVNEESVTRTGTNESGTSEEVEKRLAKLASNLVIEVQRIVPKVIDQEEVLKGFNDRLHQLGGDLQEVKSTTRSTVEQLQRIDVDLQELSARGRESGRISMSNRQLQEKSMTELSGKYGECGLGAVGTEQLQQIENDLQEKFSTPRNDEHEAELPLLFKVCTM